MYSCGDDDVVSRGTNPQNKILVGTKWTTKNQDYGVGDDWVTTYDETYNIYFYSDTEGIFYYSCKEYDSDFGSSLSRNVAHFTYNVDGSVVNLDYINNPMKFSSSLNLSGKTISMNGINFTKGTIESSDKTWLNTLQGTTGDCKWHYDLAGALYIKGSGDMADYASFSDTPWGLNDQIPIYVEIQEGVTSIGSCAFANSSIEEVYIYSDAKLSKIGDAAFAGACISTIHLPDEITVIGAGAFAGCNYLSNVCMPDNIEVIEDMAFADCKSASLILTKNLKRVGSGAFGGCEIKSWTDSKVLEYIGGTAFEKINTKELDLPSIKELGHLAFYNTKIEKIHIGPHLQKVTGIPFVDLSSSGTVTIDAQTPLALKDDFIDENCVRKWNLVVPKGSETDYKSALYWKNFKSINGESGSATTDNDESGSTTTDVAVVTENAIPDICKVKLSGSVKTGGKKGYVGFNISKTPDFSGDCSTLYVKDSQTESKLYVTNDMSFCETTGNLLDSDTQYYYQAIFFGNGFKYEGDVKSFTTLKSKKPSDLTYTIGGKTYHMVLVSDGPNGDFYMMQTELPHSLDINIAGEHISRLDKSSIGVILKSEWSTFINNLRDRTGIEWRLPTPEEWMFAAKGGIYGNGTKYAGSNTISEVAWYSDNSSKYAHDVALKNPNELELYDMSGNYAELTFGKDLYDIDGAYYGGCWNDAPSACTVTSFKSGSTSGNVAGTKYKEKNAFNGKYITIRLVYSAE